MCYFTISLFSSESTNYRNLRKGLQFLVFFVIPSIISSQPTGYYEGHIRHLQKNWAFAVEFLKGEDGNPIAMVDFPEISAYQKAFRLLQDASGISFERLQPEGRPRILFRGSEVQDSIYGDFEGLGIQKGRFTLKPAIKFKYREESVTFYNDTIRLAGTLLLPPGLGPFPAIIFTHGSHPDTRNVYYGSAMHFVRSGIAALIYDKRGVGESIGGDYRTAGISGLARDALAGIRLLKNSKDVDSSRIGIFGHSQGGWIAPMAAVLSKDVRFVIASAASAMNATDQSIYHRRNIMRQEGYDLPTIEKAAAIRKKLNQATFLCYNDPAAAEKALQGLAAELRTYKKENWFESAAFLDSLSVSCPESSVMELLFKDPLQIWKEVAVPVYLVWGDQDQVVPVNKGSSIVETLKRSGNLMVTAKWVAGVDHSIMNVPSSEVWDFPREPASYFTDMAEWIHNGYR